MTNRQAGRQTDRHITKNKDTAKDRERRTEDKKRRLQTDTETANEIVT